MRQVALAQSIPFAPTTELLDTFGVAAGTGGDDPFHWSPNTTGTLMS